MNIKYALAVLATQHKNIVMNINEFTEILKDNSSIIEFSPITSREILKTGLYGSINGMNIYVNKKIAPGTFKTSGLKYPVSNNENDWSLEFSFESFTKENEHLIILL